MIRLNPENSNPAYTRNPPSVGGKSLSSTFSSPVFKEGDSNKLLFLLMTLIMQLIQKLSSESDSPTRPDNATVPQEEQKKSKATQKEKVNPDDAATTDFPHITVSDPGRFDHEEKLQQGQERQPVTNNNSLEETSQSDIAPRTSGNENENTLSVEQPAKAVTQLDQQREHVVDKTPQKPVESDPETPLVPLTGEEIAKLAQITLFSDGIGAPEVAERLDSVIDKDGNGKLSVGDVLKIVGTNSAETGDFTPVVRFETLSQEQLDSYAIAQQKNEPKSPVESNQPDSKVDTNPTELAVQQEAILRKQFQIPARAEVAIAENSNDKPLSVGDTIVTKLDGKTFTQTITSVDLQEIDRFTQLEGEKEKLAQNRLKWENANITEYSFTQLNSGYAGFGPKPQEGLYGSPIRVGVNPQGVEDITQRSGLDPVPVASIDDMFDEIDQALSQQDKDVSVKYDQEAGYPSEIKISTHHFRPSFYDSAAYVGSMGAIVDDPSVDRVLSDLIPGMFERPHGSHGYPDNQTK